MHVRVVWVEPMGDSGMRGLFVSYSPGQGHWTMGLCGFGRWFTGGEFVGVGIWCACVLLGLARRGGVWLGGGAAGRQQSWPGALDHNSWKC